ncbi:MAG: FG-GAP-like repeat-containing protein [Deltaproteobacteria bacterium]
MRVRLLSVSLAATIFLLAAAGAARAARQTVAFFPLQNLSDNSIASDVFKLGQSLKDKLQDRFDVLPVTGTETQDPDQVRKKARGIGATYVLTGAVSRIGRTFTLDLTLAAAEDPGKGRTVVVNATGDLPAGGSAGLPPVFSRMAIEAAAKLKYQFFGDEQVGEGKERRKIPRLTGTISRSRNLEGDVISVAWGDTDRDGKTEVVAAYADGITVYRVEGDDLYEKIRLPDAGQGFIHVDAADVDGNGTPEIIAVRYISGKALTDVWGYDGTKYQRIYRDVPYFVRTLDLGKDGIVLVGQESEPEMIFKGPVYRLALSRYGQGGNKERESALPLPEGTWIYAFTTLKKGSALRFVTLTGRERLVLLDDTGKKLWESIDAVSGTETSLDAPIGIQGRPDMVRRIYLPNRLFGVDLLGDRNDELIVLNNLVTAGGFFESLRVFSNSEALCFAQDGDSLQLAWRTPHTGGSARDAFVVPPKGGSTFRIGVASIDKGKLLGKFGEWRVLWLK